MTSRVELQDRWLAALRSGEYGQTTTGLRDERDRFCCLGVACDIYNPKLWINTRYMDNESVLPDIVHADFGFKYTVGAYLEVHEQEAEGLRFAHKLVTLIRLNDIERWSFDRIANFIEKYRDRIFNVDGQNTD